MPPGYSVPKAPSPYMKWQEGNNKFRVLSDQMITGYEWWTNANKPVRSRTFPTQEPLDIKVDPSKGWQSSVKHFWAFVVWNYETKAVEILEITQSSIQNALESLFNEEQWGHPNGYDITVKRDGKGMDTEYAVLPNPHKPMTAEQKTALENKPVQLEALFDGGNPFGGSGERINVSDLPF